MRPQSKVLKRRAPERELRTPPCHRLRAVRRRRSSRPVQLHLPRIPRRGTDLGDHDLAGPYYAVANGWNTLARVARPDIPRARPVPRLSPAALPPSAPVVTGPLVGVVRHGPQGPGQCCVLVPLGGSLREQEKGKRASRFRHESKFWDSLNGEATPSNPDANGEFSSPPSPPCGASVVPQH